MWTELDGSVIYLRPIIGGGHGFHVKLATSRVVGRDYLREAYSPNLLFAAERVIWLMTELVPGKWTRVAK
jgi:hypothetical protein